MNSVSITMLYIKHVVSLIIILPLVILLAVIVSMISLLSAIPIGGRYMLPIKRAIQDALVTYLLIPGSSEKVTNQEYLKRIVSYLFSVFSVDNKKDSRSPLTILYEDKLSNEKLTLPEGTTTLCISMNGNGDTLPYMQQGSQIYLPHVYNTILGSGGGMSARIDYYENIIRDLLISYPDIKKLYINGHSMGGAIMAQVLARLSTTKILQGKDVQLRLDRTFDTFANASSGFLGYGVPRFLLYFIYAQLDLNMNTKKAVAEYSADNIHTIVTVSTEDTFLQDSALSYSSRSDNITVELVDAGHNDYVGPYDEDNIQNPRIPIQYFRSIWYSLDAMILLTALQFTGVLGAGTTALFSGVPAILPLALYMGAMVLLTHRIYYAVSLSVAFQDAHELDDTSRLSQMKHNYTTERIVFGFSVIIGLGLALALPISVSPLILVMTVLSVSTIMLIGASWWMHHQLELVVGQSSTLGGHPKYADWSPTAHKYPCEQRYSQRPTDADSEVYDSGQDGYDSGCR